MIPTKVAIQARPNSVGNYALNKILSLVTKRFDLWYMACGVVYDNSARVYDTHDSVKLYLFHVLVLFSPLWIMCSLIRLMYYDL